MASQSVSPTARGGHFMQWSCDPSSAERPVFEGVSSTPPLRDKDTHRDDTSTRTRRPHRFGTRPRLHGAELRLWPLPRHRRGRRPHPRWRRARDNTCGTTFGGVGAYANGRFGAVSSGPRMSVLGREAPVRSRRKLTPTGELEAGECHRHERRRRPGSGVQRTYVAGSSQRQVSTVAVVHPSQPTGCS
jgi:hypothetical protein